MNHKTFIFIYLLALIPFSFAGCVESEQIIAAEENDVDLSESMKKSLVYLNVSAYKYEMLQPWRSADLVRKNGYACAVGPYQILTTSLNVTDAALIEARRYGQNEYIPATVKVIDYECNLCLLELDKDSMKEPLVPLSFSQDYEKGAELESFWLAPGGDLVQGRGYLDRAVVNQSPSSYTRFLDYVVANTSTSSGKGRLFTMNSRPVGIACWANSDKSETGLISAITINHFLKDAADGDYEGFGTPGFSSDSLLDPTLRKHLNMPDEMKHGVYVRKVHNLGVGNDSLKAGDCILAVDGHEVDSRGRYLDPLFDRISFQHLINTHDIGDKMNMTIFRNGQKQKLELDVVNFKTSEMLVPYYEYGKQPEYIVTAGIVIQKLTRDYLQIWGDNWTGKVPPHLYRYYRSHAFDPTEEREKIVVLSYVMPAPITLGYQGLGRLVIKTFNGMKITKLSDVLVAQKLNPESRFDVIEFEQDNPTLVIPRSQLQQADQMINQNYGITKPINVRQ